MVKIRRPFQYLSLPFRGGRVHRNARENEPCRNSSTVLYEKREGKVEQGNCAVTLTDTYRWRGRMALSRQILAIRNIKMGRRDKLIS